MKKYIAVCFGLLMIYFIYQYLTLSLGLYYDFHPEQPVNAMAKTDRARIYLSQGNRLEQLVVKGVELESVKPGCFANDYEVDEPTYLRWLQLIGEMGANTVKVNHIMDEAFYNAFYDYNQKAAEPLYLLQSIAVRDYEQNAANGAYSEAFFENLITNCRIAVDVIHGQRLITLNKGAGIGNYRKDVSPWTLGFIVGTTWFPYTIAYTDHHQEPERHYQGKYVFATAEASAFENMLAEVMNEILSYEAGKYKQQRLVSFINEPTADPFEYLYNVNIQIDKVAQVDANHIQLTDAVASGFVVSYRMYSYYRYFTECLADSERLRLAEYLSQVDVNTIYDGYINMLNLYYDYPVLVTSYGFSTARGAESKVEERLTEQAQGVLLADTYEQIVQAGCCGAVISAWQDDWSHAAWNTQHAVDLNQVKNWHDAQSLVQFYGLLSFDAGAQESVCYVDGEPGEWNEDDIIIAEPTLSLSLKYDEQYIYLLVRKKDLRQDEMLYLPIDTTPQSGSNYSAQYKVRFQRPADFLMLINGQNNSRVLVHRRYDVMRAMYEKSTTGLEPYEFVPDKALPVFDKIRMVLKKQYDPGVDIIQLSDQERFIHNLYQTIETGALTHGNANPKSSSYNSLADFFYGDDLIEMRIPWQLLNFSDPSAMMIHADYYAHYGVEYMPIKAMYIGVGDAVTGSQRIAMGRVKLKGWAGEASYHERLKPAYYIVQQRWQ
ncbi:MAG TPA: hypothetical protein P5549_04060 [Syntrophomonas sp.]|nr:hypothetical protein [Syntrophomonas sp.]